MVNAGTCWRCSRRPRSSSHSSVAPDSPFHTWLTPGAQGLSLTLPLAVCGDLVKGEAVGPAAIFGGALVLGAFVLLSLIQKESHTA